ncbi:hypothetical protein FNV43_RR01836 [Rhamnella rubrinervis]|uniref:Uncharacterized protein n=1 Tax=Rhamnella rubrinervis TaxID=2594499 RepID=A0A8K0HRQ3_9ROSA|nr:hypothetical protein FNV43_RR01836 [Rhamnella rubrinervis]
MSMLVLTIWSSVVNLKMDGRIGGLNRLEKDDNMVSGTIKWHGDQMTKLYTKELGNVFDFFIQVKSGTLLDNVLITDDPKYAKQPVEETWTKHKDDEDGDDDNDDARIDLESKARLPMMVMIRAMTNMLLSIKL